MAGKQDAVRQAKDAFRATRQVQWVVADDSGNHEVLPSGNATRAKINADGRKIVAAISENSFGKGEL